MRPTTRSLTAATLVAAGLLAATPAHAVVDPVAVSLCLAESAAGATSLVDPSSPGIPAELPAVHCLAP
ncbi:MULTISPECIES: hypothetical protein [Nonomuraea]|uniref:Secreted protein n=2 Tax=Nonomuraea TaxID=83681 RepID=A0ABW1BYJ9_9ACTN|nr:MULTISPECIES: hypothetical protein [Nonomuraea]TXK40553.1 hypothetical protein FR742_13945 [Nonomuraea sp. C10]